MKFKDWILTAIGTGILVALIVIIVQKGNPPVIQQSSGADSKIFNNLAGKPAPDFTLESFSGEKITLSSLRSKNVILFFNEGLMCYPSCWNQVAEFGKDNNFKNKNTVVLNIVVDPKKDWQEAVTKMPELAAATVLLDTDKKVSALYGVLTLPSSMHKGQFPGHSYVVIDQKGIVRFIHDDEQMAIRNQELANEVEKL
ncbi:redoxin domain-containing protein [Candidatus Gottesmanbacteria bacterium]|nr:redoxin domain-containing protein [Candidatus Gottesmanbacteria bacterium]